MSAASACAGSARLIARKAGGGDLLLQLLSRDGWFVYEVAAFAGKGLIVGAEHPTYGAVRPRYASSLRDAVLDVFEDALALSGAGTLQ